MASPARFRLLFGLFLLAAGSVALSRFRSVRGDEPPPPAPAALRLGLQMEEVRAILGPPLRKSRQIYSHRAREQWVYGLPRNLRLVFDCKRGEKPLLRHIHSTAP
jgi:hypothetical protein